MAASTSKVTSLSKANQNLTFYHFAPEVMMSGRYGNYKEANVVLKTSPDTVTLLRMPHDFRPMKLGFNMATNVAYATDKSPRLQRNSKVLSTLPFNLEEGIVERYENPPIKTIQEALGSPAKTRLSVKGKVISVSPGKTAVKQLKVVILEEETETIKLKLWDDASSIDTPLLKTITVGPVTVGVFHGTKDVNSTKSTTIKVHEEESRTITAAIEAAGFEDNEEMVVIDGQIYHCDRSVIDTTFPNQTLTSNVFNITVQGDVVVSISPITEQNSEEDLLATSEEEI